MYLEFKLKSTGKCIMKTNDTIIIGLRVTTLHVSNVCRFKGSRNAMRIWSRALKGSVGKRVPRSTYVFYIAFTPPSPENPGTQKGNILY